MLDQQELEREIKAAIKSKVDAAISNIDIGTMVARTMDMVIAERVSAVITGQLNSIVKNGKLEKELDTKYQDQIYNVMVNEVKLKSANVIARVDIASEVGKQIALTLNDKIRAAALPEHFINHRNVNWDGFTLSANQITPGVIDDFSSKGIQDVANSVELTVADGVVVVENSFVTRNAEVRENFFADNAVVNNLRITNQLIMNEGINKQLVSLIKDTITRETIGKQVDVVNHPIVANGKEVLTENTLGPAIINSNLRKLGRLSELNVVGIAQFNDTMLVTDSGKVGINTSDPEGAFTLWDDDSDLTIRRCKKKNMYIGTMRDSNLSLGVGGDTKLELYQDGTVSLKIISLNGLKISASDTVPGHSGLPGEIVIMTNARENEPWAYRCLGLSRWQAIK